MKKGIVTEDAVIAKLSRKVDMKSDAIIDHKFKLDFVVDRIRDITKLVHIGIQIATNPTDMVKKALFVDARKTKQFVDRSLYVEIEPEVDTDSFGTELIYSAIVDFAFNTALRDKDIMGVHIAKDVTYTFFDITAQVEQYRNDRTMESLRSNGNHAAKNTEPAEKRRETEQVVTGKLVKYNQERGFGFIDAKKDKEQSRRWWFHISSCSEELGTLLQQGNIRMTVAFTDSGYTRKGADSPTAKQISIVSKKEMTQQ